MDSMIETLAEYAAGLRYKDLPPDVVHECKRKLIDTLGCAVGGFDSQPAAIARSLAARSRGNPSARVLGTRERSIERTAIRENADFNRVYPAEWPCRIEVNLKSGETQNAETRYFKGHVKNPLTDAEIETKFRMLAAHALTPAQADKVLAAAWRLEKLKDVGELLGLLKFRPVRKKK